MRTTPGVRFGVLLSNVVPCALMSARDASSPEQENTREWRTRTMAKDNAKGNGGKAPNTGSNTQQKSDNKATSHGQTYDPNRPHVDRRKD